ncbi:unnamed protein product [Durusdinium trenchii]|uniref:TRP C-terminal domain-containing protein n=1 Tax=Durusdinium trenchii TaxID=1381693 RepID=A0ABP0R7N9_9DINO
MVTHHKPHYVHIMWVGIRPANDPWTGLILCAAASKTCAKCATSTLGKSFEWCAYLLQHSIVFAVSASGVIASTDQSYKSTIHSNQLMAYVMVALPVLNQVSNSQSFKVLAYFGQEVIEALKIPVDVANGAGGDGLSSQCLLDYIGISKTLYGGDILFLILALSLMLLLSLLVDVWSAVVVACNCYLPRLCFAFGRHLVCYRLSTEDRGGQLFCGFEEDVSMPVPLTIVLLIIVCVAGPSSWLWLIRHEQITSPGAVYLTGPYKKDHKFWEVTVLLRKVLLALVSSVWPSSLDAVMQLEFIGLILLISLVVTLHNRPYLAQEHNRTEEHLLELGMLMVLATFCFHANENSWTRMEGTQRMFLIFIVLLATGPSLVMTIRVIRALIDEMRDMCGSSAPDEPVAPDELDEAEEVKETERGEVEDVKS